MGKKITNGKQFESDSEEEEEIENQPESDMDLEDEEDDEQEYQSNSDILDKGDSDSEGSEVGDGRAGNFGNKRSGYYKNSDVTDSDDSEEEEGADQIYRQNQKGLTEADFLDEDFAKKQSDESDDEDISEQQNEDPEKFKEEQNERKQKLIKKLRPEIMSLAQEMNISMKEICDKLLPIIEIEEAKKVMIGKGQNFLEIRYEILLSYTMCILFYLMLKSKGLITNNHPVLDRLTKYKTLIERMNISLGDFEQKIGEVISKHLKSSKKNNKNQEKPKHMTFEQKMKLNQKSQQKPVKESESQKLAKQMQEELKNIQESSEEDSDDFDFDDLDNEDSNEELLSEDEEDIRITKGAKATHKIISKSQTSKPVDDGEINMESVEKFLQDGNDDDDGDMLFAEPKKVNLNKIKQQSNNKNKRNSVEFEDDFYKQIKQKQLDENISKKKQKIMEKEQKKEEIQKKYEIRELKEEDSRKISSQILHNKGNLVRKRKKDSGNARVSNRRKWEKKDKIHRKQHGAQVYAKQLNYSGEQGAIKVGLKKSTKL